MVIVTNTIPLLIMRLCIVIGLYCSILATNQLDFLVNAWMIPTTTTTLNTRTVSHTAINTGITYDTVVSILSLSSSSSDDHCYSDSDATIDIVCTNRKTRPILHPTETKTRRESLLDLLSKSGVILSAATVPFRVNAATASSSSNNNVITPEEIQRIKIGYEQITYLLNHFEEETTVCRENGGECKRDANAIRKVLGLRSTTDPLFQIEKVFAKFKNLDLDTDVEALYDAAEDWNSSIAMSNSMAFISQFGEYNPGGGKDEVLKYLLESKKQVLLAKDALKTIMINLNIPFD